MKIIKILLDIWFRIAILITAFSPIAFNSSLFDKIVSTKVEPDLGSPIIKIGKYFCKFKLFFF